MAKAAGLLGQIESGALDSSTSLADTLRKCVALGGRSGSEELRDWARRELEGYDGEESLPSYREIPAIIRHDGANLRWQWEGQQLSPIDLPDFAREYFPERVELRFGVAELERLTKADDPVKLQRPGMSDLMNLLNRQAAYGPAIHALYYAVSSSAIHGVLDRIRTTLVALIAEMRAAGVGQDELPSAAVAEHAVQVVIKGAHRSHFNINTAVANGDASTVQRAAQTDLSRTPQWIRGPWGVLVGLASVVGAYAALAAGTGWPPF